MENIFKSIVDAIGSSALNSLKFVYNILPNSPFQSLSNSDISQYISGLNWFFPIQQIISIMQAWLTCVLTYYAYQIILRWTRAIR